MLSCLAMIFISKSHDLFFEQAPEFLHGKGNFRVIQHPGLAVNWMASLPLHSHLSTPPGSIHLRIISMFTSNSEIAASFLFQRV